MPFKTAKHNDAKKMNLSLQINVGHTGEITAAIAGGSLLLLGIVSLVLYRNWKYEQELDSLLWKVDYKDIQLHENDKENNCQKQTRVSITSIKISRHIIKTSACWRSGLFRWRVILFCCCFHS